MSKSPFRGYKIEEIFESESLLYTIQVGSAAYAVKGTFVFDKKSAQRHYNRILAEVLKQLKSGNQKQQKNAERLLLNLRICPLRIH